MIPKWIKVIFAIQGGIYLTKLTLYSIFGVDIIWGDLQFVMFSLFYFIYMRVLEWLESKIKNP